MKKNILSCLFISCIMLSSAVVFGQEAEEITDVSIEEDSDEVMEEIYITIDSYGLNNGMLSVTQSGEDNIESVSWGLAASKGDTIADVLEKNEITSIEAVCDEDTFEGWMEFEEVITVDEDGNEFFVYELRSGDTFYTTEELMELTVPDYNIIYTAKWASIPAEEYYQEEDFGYEIPDTGFFVLCANGGMLTFEDSEFGSYELESYNYWLEEGGTLGDAMQAEEMYSVSLSSVEKENAELAGWSVYKGDNFTWNNEAVEAEDVECFPYSKEGEYVLVENCELCLESATLEEMQELVYDGQSYLAVANWK